MPRKSGVPAYRLHRASGQAVVTLNGADRYLGRWNTPESKAAYDRLIVEWLAAGRRLPRAGDRMLIKELVLAYDRHMRATASAAEMDRIQAALKPVRRRYGDVEASKFGAVAYKAVRSEMIEAGLAISTIGQRMGVVRRWVAWSVENEHMPADRLERIKAVRGLRARRDGVKAARKVKPAPDGHIDAVLPHLTPTVRAMVEVQRLTGARPGEVCRMTTGQIDRSGDVWIYAPASHKTDDLGKVREIAIGPRAQEILKPFLKANPDAPIFSPIESMEREYAGRGGGGKRARTPKEAPKRRPRAAYDTASYKSLVAKACVKAGIPVFRPNRIRHTYATRVREAYGLDVAQVMLGHAKADVTQVYAEANRKVATDVASQIG